MKKTLYIACISIIFTFHLSPFTLRAQAVSEEAARVTATVFWDSHRPEGVKPAVEVTRVTLGDLPHLHVFDVDGQGFVIVAGDQRVRPVLAYSFVSPATKELNAETGYWLRGYEAQLAELAENPDTVQSINSQFSVSNSQFSKSAAVPALMHTRWNQSPIYNNLCPYDSVQHARTVVGCVATAMAQIMRYHSYPAYGQGSHSYNYNQYHNISADFGNTSYLWHIMPNVVNEFSQEAEITATATISYHCGVGVEMMYGTSAEGGSGAYSECGYWAGHCAVNAFVDYFKYDSSITFGNRVAFDDSTWIAILDNELEHRRPVYYHGSDSTGGHAFVLDGSDTEGRYHFNWGWGGSYDGFYAVDDLAPRHGGDGGNATYTFNQGQGIIYHIQPGYTETFDTVDYLDSVCEGTQYVQFRDYHLVVYNVKNRDTLLHHFDTVFRYHLKVISKKRLYIDPNNGEERVMKMYCPATGYTFPRCSFSKENCMFVGWCRDREGNGVIYQPGETLFFSNSPTFYALWIDTSATGIDELSILNSQFSIYPNPTTGDITIGLTNSDFRLPASEFQVIVTDMLGRVVVREEGARMVDGEVKISLKGLPKGVYNVVVKAAGCEFKQLVIKK